jgi:sugar fermentation stimulation protein A
MIVREMPHDAVGTFVSRPNRFLARVMLEEGTVLAHVHDPGRLKEILLPGAQLMLRKAPPGKRRTLYDVLAGKVGDRWVLINSSIHRGISERILSDVSASPFGPASSVRSEVALGSSRIDHLIELEDGPMYIEVKGCSLTEEGTALFPDAPTSRGTRHIMELTEALKDGHRAGLMVLVMRSDSLRFSPNRATDPDFASALEGAIDAGLEVRPLVLDYDGSTISLVGGIPVSL